MRDVTIPKPFYCFLASLEKNADHVTFKQASKYSHWIDAMNKELQALEDNHTWEINTLPPHKRAIGCKWLFKTKLNPDGSVERYKARLVILGCKQIYG